MEQKDKVYRSKKKIIFDNFLGGLAWGIGSAFGAVLLIAVLGFILAKINVIPVIGDFVSQVTQYAKQKEIQSAIQSENK